MRRDVVIVGGGPSGLTAAARLADQGLSVALIHKGVLGGDLPNLLWVEGYPDALSRTNGAEVASKFIESAQKAGVQFVLGEAVKVEHYSSTVVVALADHRALQASAVVLATGHRKRELDADIERFEGRGIIACTACDAGFYRGQEVVVAGGGMAGALDALHLADFATHVTIVEQGEELSCSQDLAGRVRDKPHISVLLNTQVVGAAGSQVLEQVSIRDLQGIESTLPASGLAVQVGHHPETEFIRDSVALNAHRLVQVDHQMRTSQPRVYAIGDMQSRTTLRVSSAVDDAGAVTEVIATLLCPAG